MPTDNATALAPSAEARMLIDAYANANYSCGAHPVTVGGHEAYAVKAQAARGANAALSTYVARLEAEVARLREVLEPFVRADRAIGAEPGPFRFETANGYRLIERDHLRAAGLAAQRGRAAEGGDDAKG